MKKIGYFKVDYKNLSGSSSRSKQAKKKFDFYRNEHSFEGNLIVASDVRSKSPIDLKINYIDRLEDLLEKTEKELNRNKIIGGLRLKKMKLRLLRREQEKTPDKFLNHATTQPKYVKNTPKVFANNPTLGYSTRKALSPDRRIADYGNMIFNNNFKYYPSET